MVNRMSKTDLIRSMEPYARGAWISERQLGKWLGVGYKKLVEFTEGMDVRYEGNAKLYLCSDVAEKMKSKIVRDNL